jgi:hypothetical protein
LVSIDERAEDWYTYRNLVEFHRLLG